MFQIFAYVNRRFTASSVFIISIWQTDPSVFLHLSIFFCFLLYLFFVLTQELFCIYVIFTVLFPKI